MKVVNILDIGTNPHFKGEPLGILPTDEEKTLASKGHSVIQGNCKIEVLYGSCNILIPNSKDLAFANNDGTYPQKTIMVKAGKKGCKFKIIRSQGGVKKC